MFTNKDFQIDELFQLYCSILSKKVCTFFDDFLLLVNVHLCGLLVILVNVHLLGWLVILMCTFMGDLLYK